VTHRKKSFITLTLERRKRVRSIEKTRRLATSLNGVKVESNKQKQVQLLQSILFYLSPLEISKSFLFSSSLKKRKAS
jgi:hypothetical protein